MKHPHYKKPVAGLQFVDVYRVLALFCVSDPCLQHAVKKLLVAGGRGAKDISQDVQEAIDTLQRWQEMRVEDEMAQKINEAWGGLLGKKPNVPETFGQQHTIEPEIEPFSVSGKHTIEPASQIDDESPRQQLIQQGGEMAAEVYGEIDRLRASEAFNADLPVREHYVLAPFQATCANLTIEQARELERNFRSRDLIQFCVTDLHICPRNGNTAKLMSVKLVTAKP